MSFFTDLSNAIKTNRQNIVINLLETKEYTKDELNMALLEASYRGLTEICSLLLQKGADVNVNNKSGKPAECSTPLMWASLGGYDKTVDFLLKSGSKINEQNYMGFTALLWALDEDRVSTVKILILAGANPYIKIRKNINAFTYTNSYTYKNQKSTKLLAKYLIIYPLRSKIKIDLVRYLLLFL